MADHKKACSKVSGWIFQFLARLLSENHCFSSLFYLSFTKKKGWLRILVSAELHTWWTKNLWGWNFPHQKQKHKLSIHHLPDDGKLLGCRISLPRTIPKEKIFRKERWKNRWKTIPCLVGKTRVPPFFNVREVLQHLFFCDRKWI